MMNQLNSITICCDSSGTHVKFYRRTPTGSHVMQVYDEPSRESLWRLEEWINEHQPICDEIMIGRTWVDVSFYFSG